jgi:hypothetical protein
MAANPTEWKMNTQMVANLTQWKMNNGCQPNRVGDEHKMVAATMQSTEQPNNSKSNAYQENLAV